MKTAFTNFLTVSYTLAIALLALVVTASYVLLIWAIETERTHVRFVQMARQQSADTATTLYLAHLTAYAPPNQRDRYRAQLAEAVKRLEARNNVLTLESGASDIPAEMKAVLRDVYHGQQNFDQQMHSFIRRARELLAEGGELSELEDLARLHISLIPALQRLTDLLRAEASEAVDEIKLLATGLWVLTLLVLAATGLFIFRPMARRAAHILTDMQTARNRAREEAAAARAAREAQNSFIRTMNHELRTPLNAVLGMAQLLNLRPLPPKANEYARDIQQAGEHLLVLINNLLDLSRLDAGEITLNEAPTRLDSLVHNTAALLRPLADEKSLTLSVKCDETLAVPYLVDGTLVQQVLFNLIGNAIKFTDDGWVEVRAFHADSTDERRSRIRFEVADTGIGIPGGEQDAIFDEFRQAHSGVSQRYPGTGLGLTISRRLVALMNGELGIDSREGQGSVFWFTLVLERASVEGAGAGDVSNATSQ
jgi:signal transduction histidine kinase